MNELSKEVINELFFLISNIIILFFLHETTIPSLLIDKTLPGILFILSVIISSQATISNF